MKKIGIILFVLFAIQMKGMAQNEQTKMLHVPVADTILTPVVMVLHSMGDVNVKGHKGGELLVYAQELLPSVTELAKQSQEQVFSFIDKRTKSPVTVSRNNNFSVQQRGDFFQIETNIFAFNNHVFVMAPERSSVAVYSRDIGNISIENFFGDVEAEANAGSIYIKNVDGMINAATVHGDVVADVSQEEEEVRPLFISTLIGNIEIIAPSNATNTVLVSSEMGNLRTNFNTVNTINVANSVNTPNNRSLSFDLNGGGSEFILKTFKGDIYLRHLDQPITQKQ